MAICQKIISNKTDLELEELGQVAGAGVKAPFTRELVISVAHQKEEESLERFHSGNGFAVAFIFKNSK